MARAPFQVLVIPYRRHLDGRIEYAVLQRSDSTTWQFIAGGGENSETPVEAAVREAHEEAFVSEGAKLMQLDSIASVPRSAFPDATHWPADLYVVPEHCFAVDVSGHEMAISAEHTSFEWFDYEHARQRLTWQSNRNALWELSERLRRLPH
jgi:dATP pyrophosphohydrolase